MATSEQLRMEKCSERQLLDPESGFKFVEMTRMSSTLRNVKASVGILSIELGDALLGALQENTRVDLELDCHKKLIPYSQGFTSGRRYTLPNLSVRHKARRLDRT